MNLYQIFMKELLEKEVIAECNLESSERSLSLKNCAKDAGRVISSITALISLSLCLQGSLSDANMFSLNL